MSSNKPTLHGRDHRAGGADPIPGLGGSTGLSMCYAQSSSASTGTFTTVNPTWGTFLTNDSSVFSLDLTTTPHTKISVATEGMYLVVFGITMNPNPTTVSATLSVRVKATDSLSNTIFCVPNDPIDITDASVGDPEDIGSLSATAICNVSTSNFPWKFRLEISKTTAVYSIATTLQIVRLSTDIVV